MKTVILAEKPSQARSYAEAMKKSNKQEGCIQVEDSLFKNQQVTITYGFGHLIEMASPGDYDEKWSKWNLDNLPLFPDHYQFIVPKDKSKQFKIVKKLLNEADTIIVATDCDHEGENIAWSIINKADAYSKDKTYKRLWINSLESQAIREGFANLKNGLNYLPFYTEAQTRQISDWLVGMNASPLYSLMLQKKGVFSTFSVGRVQTPTLYMIYKNWQDINNFKVEKYYEIQADIQTDKEERFKGNLDPNTKFKSEDELSAFLINYNLTANKSYTGQIQSVHEQIKEQNSPSLYSLSSLQADGNKRYKMGANQILDTVQSLYEKKYLSYPRTDCTYITDNELNYLVENLNSYFGFLNFSIDSELVNSNLSTKYVNAKKVQEHHAIIPTRTIPNIDQFNALKETGQHIYLLVLKRTMAMFLPPYKYAETTIKTVLDNIHFLSTGKVALDDGWKSLIKNQKADEDSRSEENNQLPKVEEGQKVSLTLKNIEKNTTPPKPYTEGTLITAMKKAGRLAEDEDEKNILKEVEGIGTEATRASVIETLKNRKYIEIKKNKIEITNKGIILCKAIENQPLLISPAMTAKWEAYLKKIGHNEGSQEIFLNNIKNFITKIINTSEEYIQSLDLSEYIPKEKDQTTEIICPKCKENLLHKKGFYGCSKYPNCKFTIRDSFFNKSLTDEQIISLLKGETILLNGIKAKSGKKYNANICFKDNKMQVESFANN